MLKYKFYILFLSLFCISYNVRAEYVDINDDYVQKILSSQDEKSFNNLIENGLDVNSRDENGDTMLHYVLSNNKDLYMAKKLIEAGADVNLPSSNGITPIIIATSKANELQLQKMMLKNMDFDVKKEIVNAKLNEEIEFEMNRAIAMLQMLIEQGADINKETPLGTPLMNASTSDWNKDIVEILLEKGAKVNQQDKNGRTALFYAEVFDCQQVLNILLKAGADISIRDKDGKTYMEIDKSTFEKDD